MTPLEFIQSQLDKPCDADSVFDDLGFDSLDFIDLVRQMESVFDVIVEDSRLMGIKTVGELANLVSSLQDTSKVCG